MSTINALILTAAIAIPGTVQGSNEQRAAETTIKALYVKSNIDEKIRQFEKNHMPKYLKENPWILVTARIASERAITFQWSF